MYGARAPMTVQSQTWLSEMTGKLTLHSANKAADPTTIMYVFLKSVNKKMKRKKKKNLSAKTWRSQGSIRKISTM